MAVRKKKTAVRPKKKRATRKKRPSRKRARTQAASAEPEALAAAGWEAPDDELANPLAPLSKWLPDDSQFAAAESALPARAELHHPFPARDQGEIAPCCVSMGICACMEILDARQQPTAQLSPLFHYYAARSSHTTLPLITLAAGIDAAVLRGIASEEFHSSAVVNAATANARPSKRARRDATNQKIRSRWTPGGLKQGWISLNPAHGHDAGAWMRAIASGIPIVFGFAVTKEYFRLTADKDIYKPDPDSDWRRGHVAVARAYDREKKLFRVKDSRGPSAFDGGEWSLPFAAVRWPIVKQAMGIYAITY